MTAIAERPILFSTDMVKAIQGGRKTQTRRVCKHQHWSHSELTDVNINEIYQKVDRNVSCPYGKPGDLLWVREEHYKWGSWFPVGYTKKDNVKWSFVAHDPAHTAYPDNPPQIKIWKSRDKDNPGEPHWYKRLARFMPKSSCRIWLEITNIRVERLQDISEEDAIAEGVIENEDGTFQNYFKRKGWRYQDGVECLLAKGSFHSLWQSIHGFQSPYESWDANPWVWVVEFKPATAPSIVNRNSQNLKSKSHA